MPRCLQVSDSEVYLGWACQDREGWGWKCQHLCRYGLCWYAIYIYISHVIHGDMYGYVYTGIYVIHVLFYMYKDEVFKSFGDGAPRSCNMSVHSCWLIWLSVSDVWIFALCTGCHESSGACFHTTVPDMTQFPQNQLGSLNMSNHYANTSTQIPLDTTSMSSFASNLSVLLGCSCMSPQRMHQPQPALPLDGGGKIWRMLSRRSLGRRCRVQCRSHVAVVVVVALRGTALCISNSYFVLFYPQIRRVLHQTYFRFCYYRYNTSYSPMSLTVVPRCEDKSNCSYCWRCCF